MPSNELSDRRQRAREAFWDNTCAHIDGDSDTGCRVGIETAIETATRVQITPEIMRAAERENVHGAVSVRAVRAALEAAGFEVVG